MTKKLIAMVLAAFALLGAMADTWTDPDTGYTWTYRLNNDGAEIYGNTLAPSISPTPTNAVIIPATLGGKSVTRIGYRTFYGCSGLKGVVIPDSVTVIGDYAFFGCEGLASITIPDSVTSIYSTAFQGCSNLLSICVNQDICEGYLRGAFPEQYQSITNLTISRNVSTISIDCFEGCSSLMYDTHTIPGVRLLDGWVAGYEDNIGSQLDLTGIRGIANGAFSDCTAIVHLKFPDGLEVIADYAFNGCSRLRSIQIPSSIKRIEDLAFQGCESLSAVVISDLDAWCRIQFVGWASNPLLQSGRLYLGDQLVTEVIVPSDLREIGNQQFAGGRCITNFVLHSGITAIGEDAFYGCEGLTSIYIPSAVTNIGSYAFEGCWNLNAVMISNIDAWCQIDFEDSGSNPLYYAHHLYVNDDLLTDFMFPEGTKIIKPYVFIHCADLAYVVVPASVENIGGCAFGGCKSLLHVWLEGDAPAVDPYVYVDGHNELMTPYKLVTHVKETSKGWLFMDSTVLPERWPQNDDYYGRAIDHGQYGFCEMVFNANGGMGGLTTNKVFGTVVIEPEVSRDGHTFMGWSPAVPKYVPFVESVVYTAIWKQNQFQVTFDPNGGSPVECSWEDLTRSVDVDTAIGEMPLVKRVGYQFCGWFLSPEDGEEVTSTTVITTNCTLYAHWRMPAVTVSAKQEQVGAKGKCDVSPKGEIVSGQAITLSAKVQNANTVFAYWIDTSGAIVGYPKKISVQPAEDESYQAVFRLKSKCTRPVFDKNYEYGIDGYASTNNMVGVAFKAQMTVNRESYPVTFSAKGLPKGLKINASTGVIDGVPTKAGTFVATITAKSAANAKLKASTKKLRITIANLPAWMRGSFGGYVFNGEYDYSSDSHIGPISLTVSSTGKISGKLIVGGTNWTLTANSYSAESYGDVDWHYLVANGMASTTIGKKSVKASWQMSGLSYGSYGVPTTFLGKLSAAGSVIGFKAIRNNWEDASAQDELSWYVGVYDWITESGDVVTLTVNETGVVKVAGVFKDGRRIVSVSPLLYTGSANLGWRSVFVYSPAQTVVSVHGGRSEVSSLPVFFKEVVIATAPFLWDMEYDVAYRRQGVRPLVDGTSTGSGSFTYSIPYGQAPSNTTVTVTAVPSKNSVFAYWLLDGEIASYNTSCGVTMGDGDFSGLTAVFRSTASVTENLEMPYMLGDDPFASLSVGVPFQAQVEIDPKYRPVKFVAKNLPAGLSLNAMTGAISGVPTEAATKTISITATSVAKPILTSPALKIPVFVEDLPAWAKGTYNGVVLGTGGTLGIEGCEGCEGSTNGLATVTVSAAGKVSGKFQEFGTNWTLSAASYTTAVASSNGDGGYDELICTNVVAKYSYKVKSGKKTVTKSLTRNLTLVVSQGAFGGVASLTQRGGTPSLATEIEAWQNLWGSTYKAVGKKLFYTSKKKQYKTFARTVEVDGKECALSLKITVSGAVTATLTFDTGKKKKGKAVYYKPTCSTVVIPTSAADADPFTGEAILYFAPSSANSFPGLSDAKMMVAAAGRNSMFQKGIDQ